MFKKIDTFIDNTTMYRLVIYVLLAYLGVASLVAFTGAIKYSPIDIPISAGIAVATCWVINRAMARLIFQVPENGESAIITGLILSLIIPPTLQGFNILFPIAASGLAIGSKYVLAIRGKHLFNPAAIAVVLTALGPHQSANWWVGTAVMAPFVLVGGLIIARKIRRGHMVGTFFAVAVVATAIMSLSSGDLVTPLKNLILTSPALFLGFIMLTEPMTSPTRHTMQLAYAALVGYLFLPQVHLGNNYTTPEIALVIGNIFAYIVSPKYKLYPTFQQSVKVAANTFDFVFSPGQRLAFQPGQYMEWTVPHGKHDSRGIRRFLTLASSPTEPNVRIGVKFYPSGSTFKKTLASLAPGEQIAASQVAGDFVMPRDKRKKLAFIAGGIGITPFRSMTKYLIDKQQKRDVLLLYGVRTRADIAYHEVLEEARTKLGLKTTYVLSDEQPTTTDPRIVHGMVSTNTIKSKIPDYMERVFYISGTHSMVESVTESLQELGVPKRNIKTDFFPGYA